MSYKIGFIKNTHGIKGTVVVGVRTDFERFLPNKTIYFYEGNKKVYLKIKKVTESKKSLLVSFFDYDDINLVLKFKGKELYTDERPELEEGEFHQEDIIDKEVYNQNGEYIGKVINVMDVPQGHIIRILTKEEKKALVPFNEYFIISVDEDKIVINEIEGLIWKLM